MQVYTKAFVISRMQTKFMQKRGNWAKKRVQIAIFTGDYSEG